jgi:hypothetical protein
LASKASFFLTESLNFLLLSSSSTMSVEWTILQGGVGVELDTMPDLCRVHPT